MVKKPKTLSPGIGLQHLDNLKSSFSSSFPKTNASYLLVISSVVSSTSLLEGLLLSFVLKIVDPEMRDMLRLCLGLVVLAPSVYGQVWGARLIASSTAALLTMVELITATVSAFLLIGTSLNSTSMIGGLIIAGAAVLDLTAPETRAD